MELRKKQILVLGNLEEEVIKVVDMEGKNVYDEARKAIDGWLENVHPAGLPNPYCMICDEEGLIRDKPLNIIATILYNANNKTNIQPIIGTCIICKEERNEDDEMDWAPLNEDDVATILNILKI